MKFPEDFVNKIICADCLEFMKDIPDKSVDLVITDPPYGVLEYQDWDKIELKSFTKCWWSEIKRIVKKDSSIYIFWSQKFISLGFRIFKPNRMLIWHHPNLAKPTKKMFLWTYDPIFYIKQGKPVFQPSFAGSENVDVFKFPKPQNNWIGDNAKYHPTSKPVNLIKNFIKISSNPNDIILDPFLGSGTTAVAAKQLGRNFIGIEISPKYCEIARERLRQEILL